MRIPLCNSSFQSPSKSGAPVEEVRNTGKSLFFVEVPGIHHKAEPSQLLMGERGRYQIGDSGKLGLQRHGWTLLDLGALPTHDFQALRSRFVAWRMGLDGCREGGNTRTQLGVVVVAW